MKGDCQLASAANSRVVFVTKSSKLCSTKSFKPTTPLLTPFDNNFASTKKLDSSDYHAVTKRVPEGTSYYRISAVAAVEKINPWETEYRSNFFPSRSFSGVPPSGLPGSIFHPHAAGCCASRSFDFDDGCSNSSFAMTRHANTHSNAALNYRYKRNSDGDRPPVYPGYRRSTTSRSHLEKEESFTPVIKITSEVGVTCPPTPPCCPCPGSREGTPVLPPSSSNVYICVPKSQFQQQTSVDLSHSEDRLDAETSTQLYRKEMKARFAALDPINQCHSNRSWFGEQTEMKNKRIDKLEPLKPTSRLNAEFRPTSSLRTPKISRCSKGVTKTTAVAQRPPGIRRSLLEPTRSQLMKRKSSNQSMTDMSLSSRSSALDSSKKRPDVRTYTKLYHLNGSQVNKGQPSFKRWESTRESPAPPIPKPKIQAAPKVDSHLPKKYQRSNSTASIVQPQKDPSIPPKQPRHSHPSSMYGRPPTAPRLSELNYNRTSTARMADSSSKPEPSSDMRSVKQSLKSGPVYVNPSEHNPEYANRPGHPAQGQSPQRYNATGPVPMRPPSATNQAQSSETMSVRQSLKSAPVYVNPSEHNPECVNRHGHPAEGQSPQRYNATGSVPMRPPSATNQAQSSETMSVRQSLKSAPVYVNPSEYNPEYANRAGLPAQGQSPQRYNATRPVAPIRPPSATKPAEAQRMSTGSSRCQNNREPPQSSDDDVALDNIGTPANRNEEEFLTPEVEEQPSNQVVAPQPGRIITRTVTTTRRIIEITKRTARPNDQPDNNTPEEFAQVGDSAHFPQTESEDDQIESENMNREGGSSRSGNTNSDQQSDGETDREEETSDEHRMDDAMSQKRAERKLPDSNKEEQRTPSPLGRPVDAHSQQVHQQTEHMRRDNNKWHQINGGPARSTRSSEGPVSQRSCNSKTCVKPANQNGARNSQERQISKHLVEDHEEHVPTMSEIMQPDLRNPTVMRDNLQSVQKETYHGGVNDFRYRSPSSKNSSHRSSNSGFGVSPAHRQNDVRSVHSSRSSAEFRSRPQTRADSELANTAARQRWESLPVIDYERLKARECEQCNGDTEELCNHLRARSSMSSKSYVMSRGTETGSEKLVSQTSQTEPVEIMIPDSAPPSGLKQTNRESFRNDTPVSRNERGNSVGGNGSSRRGRSLCDRDQFKTAQILEVEQDDGQAGTRMSQRQFNNEEHHHQQGYRQSQHLDDQINQNHLDIQDADEQFENIDSDEYRRDKTFDRPNDNIAAEYENVNSAQFEHDRERNFAEAKFDQSQFQNGSNMQYQHEENAQFFQTGNQENHVEQHRLLQRSRAVRQVESGTTQSQHFQYGHEQTNGFEESGIEEFNQQQQHHQGYQFQSVQHRQQNQHSSGFQQHQASANYRFQQSSGNQLVSAIQEASQEISESMQTAEDFPDHDQLEGAPPPREDEIPPEVEGQNQSSGMEVAGTKDSKYVIKRSEEWTVHVNKDGKPKLAMTSGKTTTSHDSSGSVDLFERRKEKIDDLFNTVKNGIDQAGQKVLKYNQNREVDQNEVSLMRRYDGQAVVQMRRVKDKEGTEDAKREAVDDDWWQEENANVSYMKPNQDSSVIISQKSQGVAAEQFETASLTSSKTRKNNKQ